MKRLGDNEDFGSLTLGDAKPAMGGFSSGVSAFGGNAGRLVSASVIYRRRSSVVVAASSVGGRKTIGPRGGEGPGSINIVDRRYLEMTP